MISLSQSNQITPLWDSKSISEALGIEAPSNIISYGVSIDSRTISDNDIFVALKGENHNGNLFALKALENGASIVIVDEDIDLPQEYKSSVIKVPNALNALESLAKYSRNRTNAKIICVTGSVGKTSTKEMLRAAFGGCGSVYASHGNFNNHFGLPLCLANMPQDSDYGVFELGMNHAGEIGALSPIARPDVSIITTVEAVHLEFFDSVEGIARAKAEIFEGMKAGGTAIINNDNPYHEILKAAALGKGLKIITFGSNNTSDVELVSTKAGAVEANVCGNILEYQLSTTGSQHIQNSLSVMAALYAASADLKMGASGIAKFSPGRGRGQVLRNEALGLTVIDETYNAGPASMKMAIENVSKLKTDSNRIILILGDMKELGQDAVKFHLDLCPIVQSANIDKVFCVGVLQKNIFDVLPDPLKGGYNTTSEETAKSILSHLKANDIVMVKGSRSMQMEKIVNEIAGIKDQEGH